MGRHKTRPYDNWRQKMNKNHDDFDGFAVNIFLDEDGDYLAHLVELPKSWLLHRHPTRR